MATITKQCRKCQEVLPLDAFYTKKSGTHGRAGQCKECELERQRQWRQVPENRERINARVKRYWQTYDRNTPERRAQRIETRRRYRKMQKALKGGVDRRKVRVRRPVTVPGVIV